MSPRPWFVSGAMLLLAGCAAAPPAVAPGPPPAAAPAVPPASPAGQPQPLVPPLEAYLRGWMPLRATGVVAFLEAHPDYDGRGVLIAILDSGLDPAVPGLGSTSTGERKILDLRDFSGEGAIALTAARLHGDSLQGAGWTLQGASRLRALSVGGKVYGGLLVERALGQMPAADVNGDGDDADSLPVVVTRQSDGWALFADTDGDGTLADEQPVRDYLVGHETFGWHTGTALSPLTMAVNLRDDGGTPALALVFDNSSHGTHVAGIAAGNDIYGVAGFDGVAPGAFLLGLKIANNAHGGISRTGSMVAAIAYAIGFARQRHVPLVLNLSFGVGNEREGTARIDHLVDSILATNPEAVFVVSAGNDGPGLSSMGFPGSASRAITVGATFPPSFLGGASDSAGPVAFFSSRGGEVAKPDLVTPGMAFSTVPRWNTGDEFKEGTSMSAPYASGLAALLLSGMAQEKRAVDGRMLRQALMVTAEPLAAGTYLDGGTGVPNLLAAWRWLGGNHRLPDIAVMAPSGGTAGWRVDRLGALPDTLQRFTLSAHEGAPVELRLRANASWLAPPASVRIAAGATSVQFVQRPPAGPGMQSGVISGWTADTIAGPAFRYVTTMIVPDTGDRIAAELGRLPPGTEVRRWFTTSANRPFAVTVASTVAGEQALAFLHEPGGAPFRETQGRAAGYGGDAAVYEVGGRDVVPGLYEIVSVSHPEQAVSLRLAVDQSPVTVNAARAGDSVTVRLQNATLTSVEAEPAVALVGAERQATVVARGSATQRIRFDIPAWAGSAAVDVALDPELWQLLTDFGVTLLDRDGRQIEHSPLHYAFGRLTMALAPEQRGPAELQLLPGFADQSEPRWTAHVSIRFYADSVAQVRHAAAVRLEPAGSAAVSFPWEDSPFPAGDAFFPLGVVVVTTGERQWTTEVPLPPPVTPLSR